MCFLTVCLAPSCPHSGTWADGASLTYLMLLCQEGVSMETHALAFKGFYSEVKHATFSIHVSLHKACHMFTPNFKEA